MVMADPGTLGSRITAWARTQPAIGALVLIGSQARAATLGPHAADAQSDWDFYVVTRQPATFATAEWARAAGLGEPVAYVDRLGRLGRAVKVSAVFSDGQLDLVIIPERAVRLARILWRFGMLNRLPGGQRALAEISIVLRGGYRVLKDRGGWEGFFRRVATELPPVRLDDEGVRALAEGFVCDYVSVRAKLARGEVLAAQRWLHHQLAETNFRLLHELRQRRGEVSYPDARRIELTNDLQSRAAVTVAATPDAPSLAAATERAAATLRALMSELVGDRWSWPSGLP
jgi:hypothetical protein